MITVLIALTIIFVISIIGFILTNEYDIKNLLSQLGMLSSGIMLTITCLSCGVGTKRTEFIKNIEPTLIRTNNTYTLIIYPEKTKGYGMIVSEEARVYNAVEVWVKINANYNHFGNRLDNTYEIETLTIADEPK